MFTVKVELADGTLVNIRHGADHDCYRDQRDLARGLSIGIARIGVQCGRIETVDGPQVPSAIVLTDVDGSTIHRYVDGVDVGPEETLWRHKDGLVYFGTGV